MLLRALLLAPLLCAAGCTTFRVTEPGQTATEQLLVSTAVDHAVARLDPQLAKGTKVFLDTQFYDSASSDQLPKYTIGALRQRLLDLGLLLVDDRKNAQAILELRTGTQSINHKTMLIGLPSIPIPIPFAGTVSTPEIALFSLDRQTGVARLALTPYWSANGAPAGNAATADDYGMSKRIKYSVLFVSWSDDDLGPADGR
ncbi:MAG TPA: DUF6655 family protein [Nevskiaceae bacterium]|nr:DUF6655 family protein [Nevskiaceae bacterium]